MRGGVGLCKLDNAPETQKYPKTFVQDCTITCFLELITLQTTRAFLLWNKSLHLCCPKALQFSEGMVTLFAAFTSISKPDLYHRKLGLVSEETAVFTPYIVILVTVTAITGVCTRVSHPACALTIARCSSPVRHLSRIT